MLTQRARYALRALFALAEAPDSRPVPISRIADEQNVPRKFLEIILAELKAAGLVESYRGKMGGYRLARPAATITFGEVIRLVDGPLALVPCVSQSAYQRCVDCRDEETCGIRRVMAEVREAVAQALDGTSIVAGARSGLFPAGIAA
ncbi:MAG: Rrf2 family transcriptional regulator [Sphingomonadaceae bacterium]|nr:Rrf2 family transcriptional regulator [Sphingomonadaceae bacterium]